VRRKRDEASALKAEGGESTNVERGARSRTRKLSAPALYLLLGGRSEREERCILLSETGKRESGRSEGPSKETRKLKD